MPRYPAHCTDLEPLPEPPENKISYILHPNIRPSPVSQQIARLQSESLYFNEVRVTYTIFDVLKEAD